MMNDYEEKRFAAMKDVIKELEKDKARLDYLDSITGKYIGFVNLRHVPGLLGWRLETTKYAEAKTVRQAIDKHMENK